MRGLMESTPKGRPNRSRVATMKRCMWLGMAVGILGFSPPAFARFYLTDSDFAYLATLNFDNSSSILRNLGPKEEATLHAEINDRKTEKSPSDRAKIVTDTLTQFLSHRRWEEMHPGQFWEDHPEGDRGGHH
jgi:hypothetical protein